MISTNNLLDIFLILSEQAALEDLGDNNSLRVHRISVIVERQILDMFLRQISVEVVRNLEKFSILSLEAVCWKI